MKNSKRNVTVNPSAKRRDSIIFFLIIAIAFVGIVVATVCSIISDEKVVEYEISENVVEHLIKTAESEVKTDDIEHISVKIDTGNQMMVIKGREYFYFEQYFLTGDPIPVVSQKIPTQLKSDFSLAKSMVQQFVEQYFSDEVDQILKKMKKVKFVVGDFTISETTANASFIYENDKIYMNPEILNYLEILPNELLIFTLIHEWLHMVQEVTCLEKSEDSLCLRFNEAMTDVIAKAIYDYDRMDGYRDSYYYAYAFISKYKERALQSYFFGTSEIMKETGKDNWKAYLFITEVMRDTVREDGISDKEAYLIMTGLKEDEMKRMALEIL